MNFSSSNCPGLTGLLLLSKVFPSYSCIVYKVQRTFGFWIDDEKNPCYVDFFSLSASHLNPNLVRCRLPFWVHLGMHQNTDILEEVPIYHKTRSAMHLFLTPHQMCNALLDSGLMMKRIHAM
jgi:hypothetical protein